jgi:outer membrane protein assembly factor BamB
LFALNPDGTERWSVVLEGDVYTAPSIGLDGTIYLGTGSWMYAFHADGSLRWKQGPGTADPVVVAADGSIYLGFGCVIALDADGKPKWSYDSESCSPVAPAIGFDGTIYMGSKGTPEIHAFTELAGSNGGYDRAPWPTARGDRGKTGRVRRRP